MSITIFTDGSSRGNPGPGGWGAVISYQKAIGEKQESWVTEIGGGDPHTTNNRMELTSVIRALNFLDLPFALHGSTALYTDSEYIVKGITSWISGWQKNNWRTAAKKPVLNQDLWQELLKAAEGKDIKWFVVKGHSGIPANERCDEIATSFGDSIGNGLYDGPLSEYSISLLSDAKPN